MSTASTATQASSIATAPASRLPRSYRSSASKSATRTATATRPAATQNPPRNPRDPQGQHAVREQEKRVARAREMRRVRQANVVTAEHYRYVIHDLRLTGILAAAMFAVIVVLHFVLG